MPRSKPTIVKARKTSTDPSIVEGTLRRTRRRSTRADAAPVSIAPSSKTPPASSKVSKAGSEPTESKLTEPTKASKKRASNKVSKSGPPERRPAQVAHLLAFAYAIQEALEKKSLMTRAEVARRLGFTRARVTQILDLTLLAPDIQEAILFLEAVDGVEPLSEHTLRSVVRNISWEAQRREWARVVGMSPRKH